MVHIVRCFLQCLPGETVCEREIIGDGKLVLTNYRLFFIPSCAEPTWNILLNLIAKVELVDLTSLKITTKLGLSFSCAFPNEGTCIRWLEFINAAFERSSDRKNNFCFSFRTALQSQVPRHPFLMRTTDLVCGIPDNTARLFPELIQCEFERMRFSRIWRVTEANRGFKICPSYPEYHIVPNGVSDASLAKIADFRMHKRFPSVVWRSQTTGAVLVRCAEPRVGLMCNRSECDEQFMSAISKSCLQDAGSGTNKGLPRLLITDARTFRMAQVKRLWGGGFEYSAYYGEAEVCFMDLPNMRDVRVSFEGLTQLYAMDADGSWLSSLERTCWLNYISQLLKSSFVVASALETAGRPVLVHCSDGWDRTAQLSSLAQLLADPYYRTIKGFCILVEREWLQFGHKFADRSGQSTSYLSSDERSPIFVQWLDCVHQVRLQFPTYFEFNETFLVKLAIHSYSGLFGTFLCNSERERKELMLDTQTCSLWAMLSRRYNRTIINHFYEPSAQNLLNPDWRLPCLRLWNALYRRALLPSYNISTGVVPLNKASVASSSQELCLNGSREEVDKLKLPGVDPPCHPSVPVGTPTELISETDHDEPVLPHSGIDVTKLSPSAMPTVNYSIECTSNITTATFNQTSACGSRSFEKQRSFIPSPVASKVAILPLSSMSEDTTVNSARTVLDLPITNDGSGNVKSADLPTIYCAQPQGTSPGPRTLSFCTDYGVGVFLADDEMDCSSRPRKYPSGRTCSSDDKERLKQDRTHWSTSNLRLDLDHQLSWVKSGSTGSLLTLDSDRAHRSSSRCHQILDLQSSILDTDAQKDCSASDSPAQGLPIPHPIHRKGELKMSGDSEQFAEEADYTMHSLPEGELLLIGATNLDVGAYQRSDEVLPAQSPGISPTDTLDEAATDSTSDMIDINTMAEAYFTAHSISLPSFTTTDISYPRPVTTTAQTNLTKSLSCTVPTTTKTVSAPSSPTATPKPSRDTGCMRPYLPEKVSATNVCALSFSNTQCAHNGCCTTNMNLAIEPNSDWDGLPFVSNPTVHCMHRRQLQEQAALKKQITQLTVELAAMREKFEQLNLDSRANIPVATQSSPAQPAQLNCGDFALELSDGHTLNGFSEHSPIANRSSPVISHHITGSTDNRSYSVTQSMNSFELVEQTHSPGWMRRASRSEAPYISTEHGSPPYNVPLDISCTDACHSASPTNRLYRPASYNDMIHQARQMVVDDLSSPMSMGLRDAIEEVQPPSDKSRPLPSARLLAQRGISVSDMLQSTSSAALIPSLTSTNSTNSAHCRNARTSRSNNSSAAPDGVAQA